jgi:WD40 repeat protein
LSPDGKYLAVDSHRGRDRCCRVWDIEHRRLVVSHEKDEMLGMRANMAFGEDGRTFCVERKSPSAQPAVLAWDLASGKPTEPPGVTHVGDTDIDAVDQPSPDGLRLLRTVDAVIKIDDRQTGGTLIEYGGPDPYFWAMFSPDGNYILARRSNGIELLDASPVAPPPSETR